MALVNRQQHIGQRILSPELKSIIFEEQSSSNFCDSNSRETSAILHVCTLCGQGFTRSNRLKLHLLTQHGGQPRLKFRCQIPGCSREFTEKGNMQVHMRKHRGEKPFECQYCFKKFTSVGNKRDHERRHLKNRPYQCEVCLKSYFRRYLLTGHLKSKHGIDKIPPSLNKQAANQKATSAVMIGLSENAAPIQFDNIQATSLHPSQDGIKFENSFFLGQSNQYTAVGAAPQYTSGLNIRTDVDGGLPLPSKQELFRGIARSDLTSNQYSLYSKNLGSK
ncbi:hypothetical protein FGO68_gene17171 [Halteria grandinella]|uniref:C2H2-type domain-containing protein n=1 Tax=Halteria grandinella TaxID=5974 RepID=A0A8J8T876_HALGN|nr:hypothetical protein FGO68_gene17171 [Halteria grandinella]